MSPVAAECASADSAPDPELPDPPEVDEPPALAVEEPPAVELEEPPAAEPPDDAAAVEELEEDPEDPHPAISSAPITAQASEDFLITNMATSLAKRPDFLLNGCRGAVPARQYFTSQP
jgi:hypothetical protein